MNVTCDTFEKGNIYLISDIDNWVIDNLNIAQWIDIYYYGKDGWFND